MTTQQPKSRDLQNLKMARVADNGETGDARLVLWRSPDGVEAIETNGNSIWADDDGFAETRAELVDSASSEIEVQLDSSNGPRVLVPQSIEAEQVERELPAGWTVGDNWSNGVTLADGRQSFPLVRA